MFAPADRDRMRDLLIAEAEADSDVVGAALTGSLTDRYSDTDFILAVRGELGPVLDRWTRWLTGEHEARHHWDVASGTGVIRVFLLPGWLEIDLTFAPEAEFRPRGPQWRTLFGEPGDLEPFPAQDPATLHGLVWHHAWHAWICLRRGRLWQAEHWISALRAHLITLACLRLDLPATYAKGAHLLPPTVTGPLEATLVRVLNEDELARALRASVEPAVAEIGRTDPALAARLAPMLAELT